MIKIVIGISQLVQVGASVRIVVGGWLIEQVEIRPHLRRMASMERDFVWGKGGGVRNYRRWIIIVGSSFWIIAAWTHDSGWLLCAQHHRYRDGASPQHKT